MIVKLWASGRIRRRRIAAELGHATSHMVVSNYDSFLDPRTWPEPEEIDRLRGIYGWQAMEMLGVVAPRGHPPGVTEALPNDATSQVSGTTMRFLRQG